MASPRAPLLNRNLDEPIARVSQGLPSLGIEPGEIRVEDFVRQMWSLAAALPDAVYAINLCENRFNFLLSFCAVIAKGQTNLLPANRGDQTQTLLAEQYPNTYVLHDGLDSLAALPAFDLRTAMLDSSARTTIPAIPLAQVAAIPFTSGSTGEPQANIKTWRTFVDSTRINAQHMLPDADRLYYALATVPGQHMWGLETSVLFPMLQRVCVDDGKPLFPRDIDARLRALDAPRLLISTPVHLRALSLSGVTFPRVERILCATAPLAQSLAADTERLFDGQLCEVFGCSEVGSTACRATASTDVWRLFDGLTMQSGVDQQVQIQAEHLPEVVTLQDNMQLLDDRQFRLLGRGSDMLEIAGKRGSLLEMNKILQSHPDVVDGVVFVPQAEATVQRLVALVVLTKPEAKATLPDYLRARVDPVFIPRPIVVVDELPREDNGKLPRAKLLAFYNSLRRET